MASKLLYFGFFSAAAAARTVTSRIDDVTSASKLAVGLLRDELSVEMTEQVVSDAFNADPDLYNSFIEESGSLVEDPSDVSDSLLERAAGALQSTAHKQALDNAVKGKEATECVCMLLAKRVRMSKFGFGKFKLDLMVPLIDFDEREVDNCDQCFGKCKAEEKFSLEKDKMLELGFDGADDVPDGSYVGAQCEDRKCLCLDAKQTVEQLRRYKNGNGTVDVAYKRKTFRGRKDHSEDKCMEGPKSCAALCDKRDTKDIDLEGICVDERFSGD